MTALRLQVHSDDMSDSALQEMTRALCGDIARHTAANAALPEQKPAAHHKGEPITLGVVLITLMTSGTAVALLNLLKSYIERDRSVSITIEKPDGTTATLTANTLKDAERLAATLEATAGS